MASHTSSSDLLAAAAYHFEQNQRFIPMYLHLLVSALFPIYTGAHASLSRPSSAAKPTKDNNESEDDDEEEETIQKMEGLTPKDAIIFPITAGLVLAGLYYLIKTYGAGIINTVLGLYFSLIGTYSVAKLINDSWTTVAGFMMPTYYKDQGQLWKVYNYERKAKAVDHETESRSSPLAGFLGNFSLPEPLLSASWALRDVVKQRFAVKGYAKDVFDFKVVLSRHNAISSILGVAAISYSIFVDKPWWLTNLQGFAVSYGALQLMSPTTFGTGTLILCGLFFYDIWAVFFTPLMVTVAKNLDVPIKLVFPRPDTPSTTPGEKPTRSYSMLGLGDIVLPGLMIALALRYDLYMYYLRKQKIQKCSGEICTMEFERIPYVTVTGHFGDKFWTRGAGAKLPAHLSSSFPKPYFTASMVGYVIGMVATLVFMSIFQHAQPALLYLVPGVLISVWGTALVRGELEEMWQYTEAITGDALQDDEKGKAEQKPSKGFFQDLWEEIFGTSDESKDKKSEDIKTGEAETSNEKTDMKSSDQETVFSFSIKHHRKPEKGLETSKDSSYGKDATKQGQKTPAGSLDDAVLVSNEEIEGAEGVSQTSVRISTQNGTAEKHRRVG